MMIDDTLFKNFWKVGAVRAWRSDKPLALLDVNKLIGTASDIQNHASANSFVVYNLETYEYEVYEDYDKAWRRLNNIKRMGSSRKKDVVHTLKDTETHADD